ncbi:hypothetical protein [Serratia fonticola]|uniref:hypothetical protein n=1 Tax=Serratia fonticola TaxID=47917 RepID=UPI0034C684E8
MAIVINHASTQRDNNDDFSPHNQGKHGDHGRGDHGHNSGHGGRGSYDERFGNDNVVDNHNRNDHNRKDHFIEEGRSEGRDRRGDCDNDRDGRDGRHCHPKLKAPIVLSPVVAVAGGTTAIGAFEDVVVIQILNNPAVLATYTLVLQPLQACDEGYVVIETAGGITLVTVVGASNVSPSALSAPGSNVVLKWNGCVWVQA